LILKIPLAWFQLTRERVRLLVAIAGIAFADILIFVQLGFRDALVQSAIRLHEQLQADIVLVSPQSNALIDMATFSERRLYQVSGYTGVDSVSPLYLDFALWKNPVTRGARSIMVVGIDPEDKILKIPEVNQNLDQIKLSDVVLFDQDSRADFGPVADLFKEKGPLTTELAGHRIQVNGLFKLGASFAADGNIVTSDNNFLKIFPQREQGSVEIGLIRVEPGADIATVLGNIKSRLPNDVKALSLSEFFVFEQTYWLTRTPIGSIFTFGAVLGFMVGIVIVYQILYSNVADHLPEYATLKAIGYSDRYLLGIVFQEALLLAVLGFIPGFCISWAQYQFLKSVTLLPITMDTNRTILVLGLTILMCTISGAIAVRKLQEADPADIF
jgi:putative ABC transport system permease protein